MVDNKVTAEEFDNLADRFESNRHARWYKAHAEMIFEILPLRPGDRVLDVGCGTGYLLRRIARTHPEVSGIGIDLAPKMVEVAQVKAAAEHLSNLTFVQADWEQLPDSVKSLLHSTPVSFLICANTFHYFADPQNALGCMASALAPKGKLIIFDRAKEGSWWTAIWNFAHQFLIKDNVRYYDSTTLLKLVEEAGFKNAKVERRIQKYFWISKIYTSAAIYSGVKT